MNIKDKDKNIITNKKINLIQPINTKDEIDFYTQNLEVSNTRLWYTMTFIDWALETYKDNFISEYYEGSEDNFYYIYFGLITNHSLDIANQWAKLYGNDDLIFEWIPLCLLNEDNQCDMSCYHFLHFSYCNDVISTYKEIFDYYTYKVPTDI